jgi:hypothetical protein
MGVELPVNVPGGVTPTGTKSEVLLPSQPNDPTTSPLLPQVRAAKVGTITIPPSITQIARCNLFNLLIDRFLL